MDIALISPDYNNKASRFPISALALGSYLTNIKNYNAAFLDANQLSKGEYYRMARRLCSCTQLIGISIMSMDIPFAKNLIDYIKEINPDIKIIVGGPHAMLLPEQTCAYKNIDFVAYTDGELTLSELIKEIKNKTYAYNRVPGLIYKENSVLKKTPQSLPVNFYDINYKLLSEKIQSSFPDYIQVLTGKGCSFGCSFCINSVCKQPWRGRSAIDIANEIEKIVSIYGVKHISFMDENFFYSKNRILEFISYYRKKQFTFKWSANCHVNFFNKNYINAGLLRELENINCEVLKFGFESGSQRVLDFLKKGSSIDAIRKTSNALGALKNMRPYYSFMIGLPSETPDEYKKTLRLIQWIKMMNPRATFSGPQYFRVYPGGELYEQIVRKYGYSEPESFEGWASKLSSANDPRRLSKDIIYPWIQPRFATLARHADTLVFLYTQDVRDYLKPWRFPQLLFICLAKIRMRYKWFTALYDIWIFLFLRTVKKKISSCFSRP